MATGAPTTTETEKPEGTTPASPPAAAKPEPPVAKAAPAAPAKKEPPKVTTEAGERRRAAVKGDDADIPADAGGDPDYIDIELPKRAEWLKKKHTKAELKAGLKDSVIAGYFKERIEQKPKLSKDYDDRRAEAKKPKAPLDNGARSGERPDANP